MGGHPRADGWPAGIVPWSRASCTHGRGRRQADRRRGVPRRAGGGKPRLSPAREGIPRALIPVSPGGGLPWMADEVSRSMASATVPGRAKCRRFRQPCGGCRRVRPDRARSLIHWANACSSWSIPSHQFLAQFARDSTRPLPRSSSSRPDRRVGLDAFSAATAVWRAVRPHGHSPASSRRSPENR